METKKEKTEPIVTLEPVEEMPLANQNVYATNPGVHINSEKEVLYTIEAADLNAYPELSQQGVQYGQLVEYNSLWVLKSASNGGLKDTKVKFPQRTTSKVF